MGNIKKHFWPHHHYILGFGIAAITLGGLLGLDSIQTTLGSTIFLTNSSTIHLTREADLMEESNIVMNTHGESVMVWQEKNETDYDVFALTVDRSGYPIRPPFRVNQYAVDDQKFPKVAMDQEGGFVVVWQSYGQDGSGSGIYGQRFEPDGQKTGSEFKIHDYLVKNQMNPDVAMAPTGEFAVTWVSEARKDGNRNIYAKLFDAEGKKRVNEFQVNAIEKGNQTQPAIQITDKKEVMVVWQHEGVDNLEIRGRVFDWTGTGLSATDTLLSATSEGIRTNPRIAPTSNNRFLVVWEEYSEDKSYKGITFQFESIKGKMVSNLGAPTGAELTIADPVPPHRENPDIATNGKEAVVVWQTLNEKDQESWKVEAQKLDANGVRLDDPFQVNAPSFSFQWMPSVAINPSGDMAVAWNDYDSEKKEANLHFKWYTNKAEEVSTTPFSLSTLHEKMTWR